MKLSWEGTSAKNVRFNEKGTIYQVNVFKNKGVITWVRDYELKINTTQYQTECRAVRTSSPNAKAKTGPINRNDSELGEALLTTGSKVYYGDTITLKAASKDNLNNVTVNVIYTYLNGSTKSTTLTSKTNNSTCSFTINENNISYITIDVVENHVVGWHDATLFAWEDKIHDDSLMAHQHGSGSGTCYYVELQDTFTCQGRTVPYNASIRIYGGIIWIKDEASSSVDRIYLGTDRTYGDKLPIEFTGSTFTQNWQHSPAGKEVCGKAFELTDIRTSSNPRLLKYRAHFVNGYPDTRSCVVESATIDLQIYY